MSKRKIAFAGTILLDVVKLIDTWPDKGMLVKMGDISKCVGGCVCNTGIDLKLLDPEVEVYAYGKVGKDAYGEYLLKEMTSYGMNCDHVIIDENEETSFTDVMTVKSTGERTFFQKEGANTTFNNDDIELDTLDCDIFHLGYLLLLNSFDEEDSEYGTRAARLLHDVQARGIRTSIDVVSEQSDRFSKVIIPALKYSDYVVINEIEGGRVANVSPLDENGKVSIDNLKKICQKILDYGVRECVVIHCPTLSCCMDKDGTFEVVPSLSLPKDYIVGSVGAGDAFCAGMLYSFLTGMSRVDGMVLASCTACCNLSAVNSIDGARNLKDTLLLEQKFPRKQI